MVESRETGGSKITVKTLGMETDSGNIASRTAHQDDLRRRDYQEEMDQLAVKVEKDYRASSRSGSRSRAEARAELEKVERVTDHADQLVEQYDEAE